MQPENYLNSYNKCICDKISGKYGGCLTRNLQIIQLYTFLKALRRLTSKGQSDRI